MRSNRCPTCAVSGWWLRGAHVHGGVGRVRCRRQHTLQSVPEVGREVFLGGPYPCLWGPRRGRAKVRRLHCGGARRCTRWNVDGVAAAAPSAHRRNRFHHDNCSWDAAKCRKRACICVRGLMRRHAKFAYTFSLRQLLQASKAALPDRWLAVQQGEDS